MSWRTTTLGILTIIGALAEAARYLIDGDPSTNPNWSLTIAAITAGWGLIVARDNKVTSEEVGAK